MIVKELRPMDGKRLRRLRKEKKLTQTELGNIINVSKVSISGYENGERTPDTDNLRRMADYFGVTSDYLLGRTDNPYEEKEFDSLAEIKKIVEDYGIEDIFFHNIEDWKNLTDEDIKEIKNHFKYITHKAKERKERGD